MALELVDLHQRFGRRVALDGVSLRVERGDCYGFLGHNGAGKTTALRIALGLLRPQRGVVRVDGQTDAMQQRARTRGLIEHPGFFRELSGLENLRRLARLDGLSPRDARREAARVLDLVGLTSHGEARAGAYSQGMRQRLGVAQALLGEPAYVLLDEPTNGLDPEGIAELRQMLVTVTQAARCTVLLSSHQLHELEGLCNRVGILRQGKLVLEGDTAELLRDARGRYRVALEEAACAVPLWQRLGLDPRGVEGQLEVDLGEHPPAEVLAALVASGARPTVFAPERPTLEALYLRVAAGESAAPSAPTAEPPAPVVAPLALPGRWTTFVRVARYEAARLARWPTLLLLGLPTLLAVMRVFTRRAEVGRDLARVRARELFSATDSSGYDAVALGLQMATPLLAFLALGLASQSIAGELAQGTLRNLLLRPIRRGTVLAGKLAALAVATLGSFGVAAGVSLALAAATMGFGDAVEVTRNGDRTPLIAAADIAPHLAPALLSALAPLACYVVLGLALGALVRRPTVALALAVALGASLDLGRGLLPEAWLPSAYLPSPLRDISHLRAFADLAFGRADALFPDDAHATMVAGGWAAVALVAASWFLRRRAVP